MLEANGCKADGAERRHCGVIAQLLSPKNGVIGSACLEKDQQLADRAVPDNPPPSCLLADHINSDPLNLATLTT